jgi:hypothetical protein
VRAIAGMLEEREFPFKAGKSKINDELMQMSIKSGRPILRPRLTDEQRSYRATFAVEIQTDLKMFLPWMFSDETMITRNNPNYLVRRIPTLMAPEEYYASTELHPIQVMVWGAIAKDFKSPLMRIQGHLDSQQYQLMIHHSGVIRDMNMQHGVNSWVFQHDGASPHRARTTRDFLAPLCLTLASDLHWPANSPDLNKALARSMSDTARAAPFVRGPGSGIVLCNIIFPSRASVFSLSLNVTRSEISQLLWVNMLTSTPSFGCDGHARRDAVIRQGAATFGGIHAVGEGKGNSSSTRNIRHMLIKPVACATRPDALFPQATVVTVPDNNRCRSIGSLMPSISKRPPPKEPPA